MRLTDAQQAAVNHIDGPLQIIACAGSGKTEVISRRIAHILQSKAGVKPENIVAFTFTEKAAQSLKSRIESALGRQVPDMYIGTIHGFCKSLLNRHADHFAEFKVLDTVKNHLFIARYADQCGMSALGLKPCLINNGVYLQCIDKLIDDYDNREHWTDDQRAVLERYIHCLYEHQYIDFSLLLFEALKQMQENPVVQAYLDSIKYLVVDEYQDVNDLQEKLIRLIADRGANVCVVGDDDQTIYQFRGSNADNMISFPERYADAYQVRLEENFRCQKGIVDIADKVICHNRRRLPKRMISGAKEEASTIRAIGYADSHAENLGIVENIRILHRDGVPYKEMAVLVRKGKHIPAIARELAAAEIPYIADSAEDFFGGNYFIRFVETLRILDHIDKAVLYEQWKDIVEGPQFNIAFKYLRSCTRGGNLRLSEILRRFCDEIGFLDETAVDLCVRQEDLDGICVILDDYDEIYGDWQLSARASGVLRFLGEQARQEYKYHNFREKAAQEDAVQLMTVHKAKGLEFHSVFLPQLNKREFPVSNMGGKKYWHVLGGVFEENKEKYQSDIEDERKLFYVAVTRAKRNLFMTYELSSQPVSCFVSESAESQFLEIDRNDLSYNPKSNDEYIPAKSFSTNDEREGKADWEEERRLRQEYWDTVKYAKSQLYDYYGTGAHFCPAMYTMLAEIKSWSPDRIIEEASKSGLI